MTLRELRIRVSPWIALFVALVLFLLGFAESGGRVTFGALYPGLITLVASLVLFRFVDWLDEEKTDTANEPNERGPRALRIRFSPWIALAVGLFLVVMGFVDNDGRVSFDALYPGSITLLASVVLFGLLRFMDPRIDSGNADKETDAAAGGGHR